jgi:tetratricopeptide (TPR) repeat protein
VPADQGALAEAEKCPARRIEGQAEGARDLAGAPFRARGRRAAQAGARGAAREDPSWASAEARPILDLVRKGQAEEALKQAMALARRRPMAAAPVHAVGAARAALGQRAQALAAFEEAVRRDPENPASLSISGVAWRLERPEAGLARLGRRRRWAAIVAVPRHGAQRHVPRRRRGRGAGALRWSASVLRCALPPCR